MPTVNHKIGIVPIGVNGVIVHDSKRPRGRPPQQLNKISIIASFSRNRRTETTVKSRPLIPAKQDRHRPAGRSGVRYMTLWDNNPEMIDENEVTLETNLHQKSKKGFNFEPKAFEVVIGLQRGDTVVVLGVTVLNITGPTGHVVELDLPLCPMGMEETQELNDDDASIGVSSFTNKRRNQKSPVWDMEPLQFDEDLAREYLLASDASLRLKILVLETNGK